MLVRNRLVWIFVFLSLLAAGGDAYGSEDFGKLLQRAEVARSADPGLFQKLLTQLNAGKEQAEPGQRAHLAYLNAYSLVFQGRYEQAIGSAQKLVAESEDPDIKFRAAALVVNAYALNRQFTEGLRYLEQVLVLLDDVKARDLRHQGLGVAALIHSQMGQHKLALHFSERILADEPEGRTVCLAEQVRLESLQNLVALSDDDSVIHKAIKQCAAVREFAAANLIRVTLARKLLSRSDREGAIALLKSHMAEVEATRYPRLIGEVKSLLAEMELEEGNITSAEKYALDTITQSASINSTLPLVTAYKTMYEVAQHRGDAQSALSAYRNFAEADKAYLNEVKAREMAYQIVRQETLQKNQQINLLDQQNQVLQLQSKLDQQSAQNTRLLVILLVVLIASIGYWAYKIKRVQLSLKKMAETDALTGLCNRHHFTLQAERSLAQCARSGEEAALIMFDLDHFKQINDRYGHQTGDWTLKRVGEVCRALCRRVDTLGRLGGEEFAFLMYGCDMRAAKRIAEDCRVRIAAIDSRESGHIFAVTASFGVASTLASGYSLARLLSHADKMLYRAKHLGRNRVCGSDDDTVTPLHGPHSQDSSVVAGEHPALSEPALAARRIERVVS
ncbi:diguanylate cyclase [Pseudoxanthomonas wuyuanensis]